MLRLLTLGGLSLVDDGAQVTGAASQRSRLALLAILAVAGPAGIAREKVLACLWPESDDERARHALKQAVYALRRDLGSEHAIAGTATLCLDASIVSSDVREFDDAIARADDAAAVAVYAGPFLDGVFVRGSAEFDEWAATERARIARAYSDAIGRMARAADAAGNHVASVAWWRKAAAAEPLSGRVALSLMRALAESGDVSEAIQYARIHDSVVQGQLETPADDAVLAFAEELRRGDWTPPARTTPQRVSVPIAAVAEAAPETAAIAEEKRDSVASAPIGSAPPVALVEKQRRWGRGAVIGAIAAVLAIAALIPGVRTSWSKAFAPPAPAIPPSPRRIVVARFANNTRDAKMASVGDIAADWVVRALLETEFEVLDSRHSSLFSYQVARDTTAVDPAQLAARQGAAAVITGSYYMQGDTLMLDASIMNPARSTTMRIVGPVVGPRSALPSLMSDLANRVAVATVALGDSAAGSRTASVGDSPSLDAYEHASRGWDMFFRLPGDTTPIFAELRRAWSSDSNYATPFLMRAYILDVKEWWPLLAGAVRELEPRRASMGRVEREALAMFEFDLRGDLLGRLRVSSELMRLNPSSVDMKLLVAVSASYINRSAQAYDALEHSDPNEGINAVTPMYWAWHAVSEHTMGRFDDELKSATELAKRFPSQRYGALALARVHAARGDTAALDSLLRKSGANSPMPTADARALALEGARELRAHGLARSADARFARAASAKPRADANAVERARYGLALYEAGDLPNARTIFTALLAADPNNVEFVGRLGTIAVRMGDSATARQIDRRLTDWRDPYAMGRPLYWRAHLAALAGRGMEAVGQLHDAVTAGNRLMDLEIITLHEDRDFESLWTDAAFRELVRPRSGAPVIP